MAAPLPLSPVAPASRVIFRLIYPYILCDRFYCSPHVRSLSSRPPPHTHVGLHPLHECASHCQSGAKKTGSPMPKSTEYSMDYTLTIWAFTFFEQTS